jgi:Fe-S cluster assembly iron-binding protein IscA
MVLDEPKETDDIFDVDGFTMLLDKKLHEQTKAVAVDYAYSAMGGGFSVTSETPIGGGGSCSPSCSC